MTTEIKGRVSFVEALKGLAEFEFDSIETYEAAIKRIKNPAYKRKLEQFKQDHVRHTKSIAFILKSHRENPIDSPSDKRWLIKAKTIVAKQLCDTGVLMTLINNEMNMNFTYEKLNQHHSRWPDAIEILKQGWKDQRLHKEWLQKEVQLEEMI